MNQVYNRVFNLNMGPSKLHFNATPPIYYLELVVNNRVIVWCKSSLSINDCVTEFLKYVPNELTGNFQQNKYDFQQIKDQLSNIIFENINK